jgi:hypothetical protein
MKARTRKHVFACLVHESRACVRDLVENLLAFNPDRPVLLYNGGLDTELLQGLHVYPDVRVVPNARPLRWGFLHDFALESLAFASRELDFDALTIVDSDQLCLKSGYTDYLDAYLDARPDIGLLGTRDPDFAGVPPSQVLSVYRELDLWEPFLARFEPHSASFPHWTFWPTTVFLRPAAEAVVELFRSDQQLADILSRSCIWATEEVLFPSLVEVLGFRVARNPCSREFVRFRYPFSEDDLERAIVTPDVFWMHPVPRDENHPLRRRVRQRCVRESSTRNSAASAVRQLSFLP